MSNLRTQKEEEWDKQTMIKTVDYNVYMHKLECQFNKVYHRVGSSLHLVEKTPDPLKQCDVKSNPAVYAPVVRCKYTGTQSPDAKYCIVFANGFHIKHEMTNQFRSNRVVLNPVEESIIIDDTTRYINRRKSSFLIIHPDSVDLHLFLYKKNDYRVAKRYASIFKTTEIHFMCNTVDGTIHQHLDLSGIECAV
jgi:hypothetical protein